MEESSVLLTDGGSSAEQVEPEGSEQEEAEQAEESEQAEQTESEESEQTESAQETSEAEQESEDRRREDLTADGIANADQGTEVLFLDLRGLNLNLLGLDVSLSELVLDVSAVEGDGNLLGNLLSSVTGLLDGGLGSLLDGLGMDFDIGEAVSSAFQSVKESIGGSIDDVPLGSIATQVITGVISQLLGLDDLMDDSDGSDSSEESDESDSSESAEESSDEGNGESEEG
jgi:hypothetical protein